jgi:hypothetical protein
MGVAVDGSRVATVDVPDTGGWQDWTTVEAGTVTLTAGTHTVRLTADGGDFNFNWFSLESSSADSGVESVANALDDNGRRDDTATLSAVEHCREDEPVPGTGGETIGDLEML